MENNAYENKRARQLCFTRAIEVENRDAAKEEEEKSR